MIWLALIAVFAIVGIVAFLKLSKKRKHWQVGYKTIRPDMLPKREKNSYQGSSTSSDNTPIWGQSYSEPKKEEPIDNKWGSWGSGKTETKDEDAPIIPPGMFD